MAYSETLESLVKLYYLPRIQYQLETSTPLLAKLTQFSSASAEGKRLVKTLEYNDTTGGAFNDNSTFDMTIPDTHTQAQWEWAFNYASINFGLVEQTLTSGAHALANIAKVRTKQARRKLKNVINDQLWTSGATATAPQEIENMAVAIDDGTNTASFGTIDRTANTWWQSYYNNVAGAQDLNVSLIEETKMSIGDEGDRPNLIVTTPESYIKLWDECFDKARGVVQDEELAKIGLSGIVVNGTTVISDRNCYAGEAYFLNTEYIQLIANSHMRTQLRDPQDIIDQPKTAGQVIDCRQLGVDWAKAHGRVVGLDET